MDRLEMLHALGIAGDVRDWLTRRLTPSELDDERAQSAGRMEAVFWTNHVRTFARQLEALQDGDEVWAFQSPPDTWMTLRGRAGLCVLRGGEVLAIYIHMLS